jgi:two-component system, chemotaxis family, chemotaxis protein CheY
MSAAVSPAASPAVTPATVARTIANFGEINLLLAEDDLMLQAVMPIVLKKMGFASVTLAKDGLEASRLLAETPNAFQLMLTDYLMPNLDGVELIEHVREKLKLAIPIVGYTASSQDVLEALAKRTAELGVKWLPKPAGPKHLAPAFVAALLKG